MFDGLKQPGVQRTICMLLVSVVLTVAVGLAVAVRTVHSGCLLNLFSMPLRDEGVPPARRP